MWRCWVLAGFWRDIDMMGTGLSMLDGSYWVETLDDCRNFPDPPDHGGYE